MMRPAYCPTLRTNHRRRAPVMMARLLTAGMVAAGVALVAPALAQSDAALAQSDTALAQADTALAQTGTAPDGDISVAGAIDDDPIESAIAGSTSTVSTTAGVRDPWEGLNRRVFAFNTKLDDVIFVPTAKAYRAVTPAPGRRGLRRFLANLRAPGVFINDILQGEFGRAGETLSRFVINTTIGAGGFADPAAQLGIAAHSEDFGQTLAVWGVPPGPFVVAPFMGPSTLRDSAALFPQSALDPINYVTTPAATAARFSRAGASLVSAREPLLEPLADIRANSLDYYASIRSFYLQARQQEIRNGRTDYSDLPDIGDFDDFDDFDELE